MSTIIYEVTIIFLILISITILFEISIALITKFLKKKKISLTYLSSIFRELTLLGLISFLLFVVASQSNLSEREKHVVEEVHMTLFLSSIFYVILVILIGVTYYLWSKQFQEFEHKRPPSTLFSSSPPSPFAPPLPHSPGARVGGEGGETEGEYHLAGGMEVEEPGVWQKMKNWFAEKQVIQKSDYLLIRDWVILKHSLSGNYPYPSYLQLCSSKLIVSLIEIDVKVWFVVAIVLGVASLLNVIADGISNAVMLVIILVAEYLMLGVAILLTLKITDIMLKLKKLPIPVDSPDYGEEMIIPINDLAYDRKIKRSLKRRVAKTLFPWMDKELKRNRTAGFFWLRSRGLFRGLLQIVVLSQAIYMAFFAFQGNKLITVGSAPVAIPFVILPAFLILLVFVPLILPAFLLVGYSGDYVNRKLLRQVLEKEKAEQEKEEFQKQIKVIDLSDDEDHSAAFLPQHEGDH